MEHFLKVCPESRWYAVDDGILLIKYWLEVGEEEQKRRFAALPISRCVIGAS